MHRWVVAQIDGWDAIEGKEVMHLCDNPACYRYDHLRIGTRSDNMQDSIAKGRFNRAFGEGAGKAKLTEAIVIECRRLHAEGRTYAELGRQYGISAHAMKDAVDGKTWKHIARE